MNELRLEVPRLNPVPFIVADVVLLGAAFLIGWRAPDPISPAALAAISVCVATGAVAFLYPFVVNHARRQEEALQDRANQIEALARTVAASAEQISIAASNLPAIAENSARQLKAAEQLPTALKEQLAGLQQQLSATAAEENAALRHELDTLRSAQTDKLGAALDGLGNATAELARLEKLAAQHSASLDQAVTHLPRLADAFGQQASDALRRETAAAVAALHAAASEAGRALAAATDEARQAFDRGVRDAVTHLAVQASSTPPFPAHSPGIAAVSLAPAPAKPPADSDAITPAKFEPGATPEEPASASQETPAPPGSAAAEPAEASPAPEPEPTPDPTPRPAPEAPAEPASTESVPSDEASSDGAPAEPALSNDGYTRLVVTAYIGIGNKLFVRGDGPGLRRDKGVPLQFVSIGKWRWESAELLFPVTVKLYKNDQVECTALGELTLEPGHHHEITATF